MLLYWSLVLARSVTSQIAKLMGATWGPPGLCRSRMGPMLAPWTLLSGILLFYAYSYVSVAQSEILYSPYTSVCYPLFVMIILSKHWSLASHSSILHMVASLVQLPTTLKLNITSANREHISGAHHASCIWTFISKNGIDFFLFSQYFKTR